MKKLEQLRRVVSTLLDPQNSASSLRPVVVELKEILAGSQTVWSAPRDDISSGQTRTTSGLALSPTMAAMCADDYVRTVEFIRGTYAAISDVRDRFPDRPARVLYIGCGPYATLAVPLMAVFSAAEATFTLIDVHSESIASAKSVVETLGLSQSITSFETLDAGSYGVCPERPPDVILIEIMQRCLASEPQVAITRHLLRQAPNAILVPDEVKIHLMLVDPSREFDLTALEQNRTPIPRDRIPVGPVFVLNRATVSSWEGNGDFTLPAATVKIPDSLEERYQPMLFTDVCIYQDHVLKDYDSGLTYPQKLRVDGSILPGATIDFYYELGDHPRLNGSVRKLGGAE
ncbi:MAG: hypothetical protein ABL888_17310 [Pirellulaceae bacterium]